MNSSGHYTSHNLPLIYLDRVHNLMIQNSTSKFVHYVNVELIPKFCIQILEGQFTYDTRLLRQTISTCPPPWRSSTRNNTLLGT